MCLWGMTQSTHKNAHGTQKDLHAAVPMTAHGGTEANKKTDAQADDEPGEWVKARKGGEGGSKAAVTGHQASS